MHPLPEYPRPAMRRDSYENLNGLWKYAITQTAEYPAAWDGSILVPYSPETKASGVGRTLQPGQWLHYHCTFAPPPGEGGRVLLHFGAVDDACAVQVNGHLVGGQSGRLLALHTGCHRPAQRYGPQQPVGGRAGPHGQRHAGPGQADPEARRHVLSGPERHLADGLDGACAGKTTSSRSRSRRTTLPAP